MVFAQMLEQFFDTQAHLPYRFAARKFYLARCLDPGVVQIGIFRLKILARHAFPYSIINVEQIGSLADFNVVRPSQWLGCLNCAGEGTGVHGIYFQMREPFLNFARLGDAAFIQWYIRASAKTVVAIPLGLTVTDENKAGTNNGSLNLGLMIFDSRLRQQPPTIIPNFSISFS